MLIVEGPDGAGKTTLIEALQKEYDLPVAPRVVSKDAEAMVDLRHWVDQNLDKGFQRTIFDRHRLISEPIYGPVLRKKQEDGFDDLEWLAPRMKEFYSLKPVIIYCLPDLETVRANIKDDDDNRVVQDHIDAIYAAYVARASIDYSLSPGIVRVWNYTQSPTIKGLPIWFPHVHKAMNEGTK